jgi:hypothetical protein
MAFCRLCAQGANGCANEKMTYRQAKIGENAQKNQWQTGKLSSLTINKVIAKLEYEQPIAHLRIV